MGKKKLSIAFFGDDFARLGKGTALMIQKFAEELVTHHADEVDVVLLRPEGKCNSVICGQVRHVIIPRTYSTLLSYLWFFITHRQRYDVVVFNRVVYPGSFFLRAKKHIFFAYDASISEVFSVPRTWVNFAFEYYFQFIGQYFIDSVIAVSDDARRGIAGYYKVSASKVHTIYPAAGDEYIMCDNVTLDAGREKLAECYGIRPPFILDVSRFDPHKNIERVIDAFFILKTKHSAPHSLVLIGGRHTPDYSDIIEAKIQHSPYRESIFVFDYVVSEDMPVFYNCADIMVYPSLVEGFGLPAIEAMKCGTPVITSNISSLPEVSGGAAFLVDPLSTESIANGIWTVARDPRIRNELVEKGLRRAADFSWAKSTGAFLNIISDACES